MQRNHLADQRRLLIRMLSVVNEHTSLRRMEGYRRSRDDGLLLGRSYDGVHHEVRGYARFRRPGKTTSVLFHGKGVQLREGASCSRSRDARMALVLTVEHDSVRKYGSHEA